MAGNRQGALKARDTRMRKRAAEAYGGEPFDGAAAAPPDDRLGYRVTVPLADSGRIDWDRVPAAHRDALDGAIRRELPIQPPPDAVAFDDALVGLLYDAISSVGVTIARASGYTVDTAAQMKFTAEEKAALVPMTNKVLAKYSAFMGQYQDEIVLAVCLGSMVSAKVSAMRAAQPDVGRATSGINGEAPIALVS